MRSDAVSDGVCFKAGNACFSSEHAAISFCDLAGHYSERPVLRPFNGVPV